MAAHKISSGYYLTNGISDLDDLLEASWHLKEAGAFDEMANLILLFSEQLIRNGDWDECLYLNLTIYEGKGKISQNNVANACNNIGLIYDKKGEWDKALEYYLKSEKIRIEVGDKAGLAVTYFNIGTALQSKGDQALGDQLIILAGYIAMCQ